MRLSALCSLALLVAFSLLMTPTARGDRFGGSSMLTAKAGQGAGVIEVAPTSEEPLNADGVRTFHVQGTVNIERALDDASYRVARAVDPGDIGSPDGRCPAVDALSLAWRSVSDVLSTSAGGAGALHFEIAPPAPTPFVSSVTFDVQWQVIKINADGSLDASQELRSECFTVTVK